MTGTLLTQFLHLKQEGRRGLAILVDPDKAPEYRLRNLIADAESAEADFIFLGGSLVVGSETGAVAALIKSLTRIPVVLFPGSAQQVAPEADALLLLSLISGRNPELLIGAHVLAAPALKRSGLEILPTGYLLVDGGRATTVHYISNSLPIPHDKPEIAACTALAGEMLGLRLLYLDTGSGAQLPVSPDMVSAVAGITSAPIIVGGGIRTPETARALWDAGATVVVIGNYLEKEGGAKLLESLSERAHRAPVSSPGKRAKGWG